VIIVIIARMIIIMIIIVRICEIYMKYPKTMIYQVFKYTDM